MQNSVEDMIGSICPVLHRRRRRLVCATSGHGQFQGENHELRRNAALSGPRHW